MIPVSQCSDLQSNGHQASGPQLYLDASGTFGCGARWGEQWFQLPWPQGINGYTSIAQKELLPTPHVIEQASGGDRVAGDSPL